MHINLAFIKNKLNALILNISNNKITEIKGFDNLINLQQLYLYNRYVYNKY